MQQFFVLFIPLVLHSFICSFVRSFVRSFIRSFVHSFIHSFIHSFVRSFVRSFIHSFICLFIYYLFIYFTYLFIYFHFFSLNNFLAVPRVSLTLNLPRRLSRDMLTIYLISPRTSRPLALVIHSIQYNFGDSPIKRIS